MKSKAAIKAKIQELEAEIERNKQVPAARSILGNIAKAAAIATANQSLRAQVTVLRWVLEDAPVIIELNDEK